MTDKPQMEKLVERTAQQAGSAYQDLSEGDYKVLESIRKKFEGKTIPPCMPSTEELLEQLKDRSGESKPVNKLEPCLSSKHAVDHAKPAAGEEVIGGQKPPSGDKAVNPAEGAVEKFFDNTSRNIKEMFSDKEINCMPMKDQLERDFADRLKGGKYHDGQTPGGLKPAESLRVPNKR